MQMMLLRKLMVSSLKSTRIKIVEGFNLDKESACFANVIWMHFYTI